MTLTGFIATGFDLEDRQYVSFISVTTICLIVYRFVVWYEVSNQPKQCTSKQLADLQEKQAALQ
jgi:hypothetical protein